MLIFVLAPSDLETTSRIPANSNTARTDPPAMIPVPAAAGLIITLAAPLVPIASWATVLPSIRGILINFLLAFLIAFLIASGTSLAFPIPNPTFPLRSPITTVAEYLLWRPPLFTLTTLLTSITNS